MGKFKVILVVSVCLFFGLYHQVQAATKEFNVVLFGDYAGPYADVMKFVDPCRISVIEYWNETEGMKLGVKLIPKIYDIRYDANVVASIWPGILSSLKPILILGMGGPDTAALQEKLPRDGVPGIVSSTATGFNWRPNMWYFCARPTQAHEMIGGISWYIKQHPEKKPLRIAFLSSKDTPAFADLVDGVVKYIETVLAPKGQAIIVAKEWTTVQPVDVSSQMKKIIDAKADMIVGNQTTAMSSANTKAQQMYGVNIPTISNPHHTIWPLGTAMKNFALFEGHLEVAGHASVADPNSSAAKFYKLLQSKYDTNSKLVGPLNPIHMLGLSYSLLGVRAIEHAVKKVGADKLTGRAVYEALATGTFTEDELEGVLPALHFSKDAPFPSKNEKIFINTVKDGKYQPASPDWVPIPSDIAKW
jgi:branched-chain amino acid transport system substrate-binding protein